MTVDSNQESFVRLDTIPEREASAGADTGHRGGGGVKLNDLMPKLLSERSKPSALVFVHAAIVCGDVLAVIAEPLIRRSLAVIVVQSPTGL